MFFIPKYIFILFITISIDYFAALAIDNAQDKKKKKAYLIISIISTCLVLFIFKYYNFFISNFNSLARILDLHYSINIIKLILPIGLSFHTFQSLSYVIEVYYGRKKPERHFGIYSLYVMFFPQLVAGPIERPQNLLPQFYEKHYFDYQRIVDGLKLMAWGMFKKVVIADRLAILVNNVYDHPTKYQGIPLFIATLFFTFQIYCDFSGYTDIARGAARILGFRLMLNFRQPYLSKSVSEFWQRWHISLSTWFRDYVYIPLGGNRVKTSRLYINLFLTFTISGLWHGANWTFVFWGMLNGFYLIIPLAFSNTAQFIPWKIKIFESSGAQKNNSISPLLKTLLTFILIFFSWILFRAHSLTDVSYIITNMFHINFQLGGFNMGLTHFELLFSVFLICLLVVSDYLIEKDIVSMKFPTYPKWIRWSFYYALIFGILIFGVFEKTQFIYFQF